MCEKETNCLENNCDTCAHSVCYRAGHSDSCSTRINAGAKHGGLVVVRCLTCVQGEKDRQAETKVDKTVKSKTTGEAGGAESEVHNT